MNQRKHARLRKIQRVRRLKARERRMAKEMADAWNEMVDNQLLSALRFGTSLTRTYPGGHVMEVDRDVCALCGATAEDIEGGNAKPHARSMTGTFSNTAGNGESLTLEKLEAVVRQMEKDYGPIPKPRPMPWEGPWWLSGLAKGA